MKRRRYFVYWFLIALWSLSGRAHAVLEDLYAAEVQVEDETPQARQIAMRQAFAVVLTKVSGREGLEGRPGFKGLLKKAADYAQQFRYLSDTDENGEPRLWLWVQFDRNAVRQALSRLGVVAWESGRPQVLVWLALARNGQRALLDPERDQDVIMALRQAARQRGLPILLPLMDLQDRAALSVADVWGGNERALLRASERYAAPIVWVGRVQQPEDGMWRAKWMLLDEQRQKSFSSTANSLGELMQLGVRESMAWLAQTYAPASGEAETVNLRLFGIDNLARYAHALAILGELLGSQNLFVRQVRGDELDLEVKSKGGVDWLRQQLSLRPELRPLPDIPDKDASAPPPALTYRLE